MTCDRERLMAYLYDELDTESRGAFEEHVRGCAQCRDALEELGGTRRILQAWPDEDPRTNLVFVRERDTSPGRWKRLARRDWRRPAVGAAMAAAAVLLLALLDLDLSYEGGRLSLRLDLASQSASAAGMDLMDQPITRQELLETQARTLEWVQAMMGEKDAQRQQVLDRRLSEFARALEQQRYDDLYQVDWRLKEIDRYTESRFQRNEAAIQWLVPVSQGRPPGEPRR